MKLQLLYSRAFCRSREPFFTGCTRKAYKERRIFVLIEDLSLLSKICGLTRGQGNYPNRSSQRPSNSEQPPSEGFQLDDWHLNLAARSLCRAYTAFELYFGCRHECARGKLPELLYNYPEHFYVVSLWYDRIP